MKMFRFAILAVAGIGFLVSAANAQSTVNYYITTVNATPTGGTWQVYADVSHDNDGLASYYIDVLGGGGVQVTSSIQALAPHPVDPSNQYQDGNGGPMGFNNSFDFNGTLSGGSRIGIIGGQTIAYQPPDDPTRDMGDLVGVGQEPSSASPQNGTQGPIDGSGTPTGLTNPIWAYQPLADLPGGGGLFFQAAGTLIEQGSYSITTPGTLTVQPHLGIQDNAAQVLGTGAPIVPTGQNFPGFYPAGSNQLWGYDPYQQGNTPFALTTNDTISVPEPASLGALVMLGAGLMGAGRRMRRPQA